MSGIFDQVINYAPPSLLKGTVTYKGTWSAATNTPTLINPPDSTTNGFYYVVSAAGTQFSLVFNIGDWIISNGSAWEKVDNTDAVSSVFGRTGAVVGVSTDYSSVGITATAVGASSPSTGAFTTLSATTPLAVASGGTGVASSTGTTNVVLSGSPTITTPVIAQINDANGNETLKLASIASAVNEVTIENAATGNAVHISATGGDASVGLHLAGKGASGYVNVQDSVDATKRIMFNASGGTTNTRTMLSSTQTVDRTLSLPDATDTLVGVAATQTLSNKTLTSPTLTAPVLGTPASGNLASCTGYVGTSALVTVGALNSGSITSGFGSIDVGADAISGGAITGSSLSVDNNSTDIAGNFDGTVGVYSRWQVGGTSVGDVGSGNSLVSGGSASDFGINVRGANKTIIGVNSAKVAEFTSTGLNSTAIGATTPSTGAFTTVSGTTGSFTGNVSTTQGGATTVLANGIIGTTTNTPLQVYVNNGSRMQIEANGNVLFTGSVSGMTGLAVTGQISASYAGNNYLTVNGSAAGNEAGIQLQRAGSYKWYIANNASDQLYFYTAGTTIATISTTGLAVAGTLSATGTATLTGTTTAASSSLDITSGDPAIRLKWTTSPVADQNTFEIRNVGGTSNTHLQFRTINDAESVFSSKLLLWQSGGLYLGTGSVDPGAGNLAVTGTVTSTGNVTMGSWPIIGNDGNATYILQSATAITSYTAGTATGTLTNAPAAGNPTKWMTINDNGTLRRIPTW